MLIEGLVGVVAMIAAATLPVGDWAAMNTELGVMPRISRSPRLDLPATRSIISGIYEQQTQETCEKPHRRQRL